MKKYSGLWIGRLNDSNVWYHAYPFSVCKYSETIHIVRHRKAQYNIPNAKYHLYNDGILIANLFHTFFKAFSVLRKYKIDYLVNFNPFPWGVIAWILAKIFKKPIVLGYIGKDYNERLLKTFFRRKILIYISKHSNLITTTGSKMRTGLIQTSKINDGKVIIYPHCVLDKWFESSNMQNKKYDIINTSQLIPRKRIQDILHAIKILVQKGIYVNVVIVGDGPEKDSLIQLRDKLGIKNYIDFVGYKINVLDYYESSKIYIQSSDAEGLSLSLIEAMVTGVVPIATRAGCEEDIIENHETGLLISIGNPKEIAEAIEYLQENNNYNRIRQNILANREKFHVKNAISSCNLILEELFPADLKSEKSLSY